MGRKPGRGTRGWDYVSLLRFVLGDRHAGALRGVRVEDAGGGLALGAAVLVLVLPAQAAGS